MYLWRRYLLQFEGSWPYCESSHTETAGKRSDTISSIVFNIMLALSLSLSLSLSLFHSLSLPPSSLSSLPLPLSFLPDKTKFWGWGLYRVPVWSPFHQRGAVPSWLEHPQPHHHHFPWWQLASGCSKAWLSLKIHEGQNAPEHLIGTQSGLNIL